MYIFYKERYSNLQKYTIVKLYHYEKLRNEFLIILITLIANNQQSNY